MLDLVVTAPQRAASPVRADRPVADTDPVAEVVVDVVPPHLDRLFEYAVPREYADTARPGVRVKVRFAGQDVDGFVVARKETADHRGTLTPLRRVVSPEPVLTPDLFDLCRGVADEYAGTLVDVLRLAVPPRHARAERALDAKSHGPAGARARGDSEGDDPGEAAADLDDGAESPKHPAGVRGATAGGTTETTPSPVDPSPVDESRDRAPGEHGAITAPADTAADPAVGSWQHYPAGPSFLRRVAAGEAPAAAWSALPVGGGDWAVALAQAAAAAVEAGRGAVLVVPDHRDLDRVDAALTDQLGSGRHVRLSADQGPQARYTAWLKVLRGHVRCVVGTRAAAFAPVHDLGLVAWWDDGDDLLAEPRAPYPHVRSVLLRRARSSGAALLSGGFARTVEVQQLVEDGTLREIVPDRALRRRMAATVRIAGEGHDVERDGPSARAHLPSAAWRAARAGLDRGPVLVQVPRRGYLPSLSCFHCRTPVRCTACHGPVSLPAPDAPPTCRRCGLSVSRFVCAHCGSGRLRSSVVGARRTAEELGRAFPGALVRTSGSGDVLAEVPDEPALVIATPGAEPVAPGGYAATLLLDAWASLDRPTLDAGTEALRRWTTAAALTRPSTAGGIVVLAGTPEHTTLPVVEALVRWAPEWFAARELAERRDLDLPPATWSARLTGPYGALVEGLAEADLPPAVDVLGPLEVAVTAGGPSSGGPTEDLPQAQRPAQALLRAPREAQPAAAAALGALKRRRSARRVPALAVRVGEGDLA